MSDQKNDRDWGLVIFIAYFVGSCVVYGWDKELGRLMFGGLFVWYCWYFWPRGG
jgi:hypothetical protein